MSDRTEINDPRDETQAELIDNREGVGMMGEGEDERGEALTTKDISGGVAVRRAREQSQVRPDSQKSEEREAQDGQRRDLQAQSAAPLFDSSESETFRSRWFAIQSQFVDEPRTSVEQADQLVAATMKRLAEIFSSERENLEREWDRGENISTEELRIALQRYRSFFDRLLSV